MPIENSRDPRATLMRDKYFTMRPKPLERWVWQQGLPASAERIYWYHWLPTASWTPDPERSRPASRPS